ncbi:MAG: LysM peptidoglycan-binding domain-containing protein [Bacillota bacterium]|nr:LysM peptidoglycan-binding domain-containing protein [Bacillota bacterium]
MDTALSSLIQSAAGNGTTTNNNSRYYGAEVKALTLANGTPVKYLARRILPQPGIYTSIQNYVVVDGDRLDNLASKFLGDPTLWWVICDVNGTSDPDELTAQAGRTIVIPLAAGVPAGARNG